MRPHPWLVVVFVGALIGLVFAGLSTYDFVQHLRSAGAQPALLVRAGRQQGDGLDGLSVAMMSEYSSVLRARVWGGIPIALPAMAVFAFIGCFAVDLLLTRRKDDPRATAFARARRRAAGGRLADHAVHLADPARLDVHDVRVDLHRERALPGGGHALWRRAGAAGRAGGTVPVHGAAANPAGGDGTADGAGGGGGGAPEAGEATRGRLPSRARARRPGEHPGSSRPRSAWAWGSSCCRCSCTWRWRRITAGRFVGTCGGLARPADTYGVMVRVGHERGSRAGARDPRSAVPGVLGVREAARTHRGWRAS